MIELDSFYNDGTGWVCRGCARDLRPVEGTEPKHSRLFREGEAESKDLRLSNAALAKWTDKTRMVLTCPRCGVTEPVERS